MRPVKNERHKETTMLQHAEQRRRQAVARSLAGDTVEDICQQMACATSGLYKWKTRYRADDPSWARARARRPKTQAAKIPARIAHAVVQLRQTLAQNGQSCGAAAIRQALKHQGLEPTPSPRTIYRILQHHEKAVRVR
jgi:transposase